MEAQVYDFETAIVHTRVRGRGIPDITDGAEEMTDAVPGARVGRRSR
jgi:hypothetical protein